MQGKLAHHFYFTTPGGVAQVKYCQLESL